MQAGAGAASNIGKIYKVTPNNTATWNYDGDTTPNSYQYFNDLMYNGQHILACGAEVAAENQYEGEFCLTSLDTSGNLNWSTTLRSPKTPWNQTRWFGEARSLVENSKGELLAGGLMKFTQDQQPHAGIVVKFSANGDSLGYSCYSFSRDIKSIRPDGNGNFVAAGTGLTDTTAPDLYLDKALFTRLSDDGILSGKQLFGDSSKISTFLSTRYYANDILPLGNNGFLLAGSGFRDNRQAGNNRISYLVAFTASGLSTPELALSDHSIRFYPNPAQNSLFFNKPFSSAKIYQSNGSQIMSINKTAASSIDISRLANGLYWVSINEEKPVRLVIQR
jgi:hypothetical protein